MRRGYWALAASSMLAFDVILLEACGDDSGAQGQADASDASMEASGFDATTTDGLADATSEAGDATRAGDGREAGDGGEAGNPGEAGDGGGTLDAAEGGGAVFLTHFDNSKLPEGLWELGDGGMPIVGLTALASLVTVTSDGGIQAFGSIGDAGSATNSNTLGITTDVSGNVYVGVGTLNVDGGPVPPPGVYKFPPDGGAGSLFSSAPGMNFANGLDFIGGVLYVADSGGTVYAVNATGNASAWSADPLLAPDMTACDAGLPAPIGANGIVHDANNMYVTNSNHGRIVKIPIAADGGAGAASSLVDDCSLVGADGLVLDTRDSSLLVAVNVQNKLVRVAMNGQMSVVASGAPLDFPASVIIDSVSGARRLLFTNAALFSGDAGRPGLLALPIP
jgi:sugar lactone lactonase YvrE